MTPNLASIVGPLLA